MTLSAKYFFYYALAIVLLAAFVLYSYILQPYFEARTILEEKKAALFTHQQAEKSFRAPIAALKPINYHQPFFYLLFHYAKAQHVFIRSLAPNHRTVFLDAGLASFNLTVEGSDESLAQFLFLVHQLPFAAIAHFSYQTRSSHQALLQLELLLINQRVNPTKDNAHYNAAILCVENHYSMLQARMRGIIREGNHSLRLFELLNGKHVIMP